jgi:hypothetical protein
MHLEIPESILVALREHQATHGWVDDVTVDQDAFMLFGGMGAPLYLSSSGRFFTGPEEDETFLFREATDDEAVACLVIGAKLTGITELLTLVPSKPANAMTCVLCMGSRWHPIRSVHGDWPIVLCPQCSGRGWGS